MTQKRYRSMESVLRRCLKKDSRSYHELKDLTGVPVPSLSMFVRGKRGLGLKSADKLGKLYCIEIREP